MPKQSQNAKRLSTEDELKIPENLLCYVHDDARWRSVWEKAAAISIAASEDRNFDEWHSRTWQFTRMVKARFSEMSADAVFDIIAWGDTEFDEEDEMQFVCEWNSVHHIPGHDPLTWAFNMSTEMPVNPPSGSPYRRFKAYGKFVGLVAWLQVAVGPANPIFMPSRRTAEMLLLKSKTSVANMTKFMVEEGLIKQVTAHTENKSPRYLFDTECLSGDIRKWLDHQKVPS